jgi:hypothetical protein
MEIRNLLRSEKTISNWTAGTKPPSPENPSKITDTYNDTAVLLFMEQRTSADCTGENLLTNYPDDWE